jgi:lipopolysaccharide/colanic/teichoic acid biosynthesis glycosyltransferase
MKRLFDIFFSLAGIILLSPICLIIIVLIITDSSGGPFYRQSRVGKLGKDFFLLKFRSMRVNADKQGLLTVGQKDARITKVGFYLRKYKLDELPQLINILLGYMSIVGPRPEVRKYVDLYPAEYQIILTVRPGLTDASSLKYSNENELLGSYENAEEAYVKILLPEKMKIAIEYINKHSLRYDFTIILLTIKKIFWG